MSKGGREVNKVEFTSDHHGALTQVQPNGSAEGGDSVNWTGHYYYLKGSCPILSSSFVDFFEVGDGAYVRHPDPSLTNSAFGAHYEDPWNGCMSRDQLTGVMAGLIASGDTGAKLRFVKHHACSLFLFAYNTIKNGESARSAKWKVPDVTLFDFWATEIRMFKPLAVLLYPLLCVLDLHVFFACLTLWLRSDSDIISLMIKHIISVEVVPTPVSLAARKVLDRDDVANKLTNYWSYWRKQPGMVELYLRRLK